MDPKFGGVILTKKGKSFKFDDTNCMTTYLKNNFQDQNQISSISTIDYNQPEKLIDATNAVYILSPEIKSPMASGIASFSSHESLSEFMRMYNGSTLTWDEVKANTK
jgi:copper chaperone NosL